MIESTRNEETQSTILVLRPNNSLTWRLNLVLLLLIAAVSISIALSFLIAGAWVILPFSLVELVLLALCIHYVAKQCARQEVITSSEFEVLVEMGIRKPTKKACYQRIWSKFFVRPGKSVQDPEKVVIRSHGDELEIGEFLNKDDKADLVRILKKTVAI